FVFPGRGMAGKRSFRAAVPTKPDTGSRHARPSSRSAAFIRATTTMAFKAGRSRPMVRSGTSMHRWVTILVTGAFLAIACTQSSWSTEERATGYGLGRLATEEEIRAWNIDVSPNGEGLPPGKGTVRQGAAVYASKCAKCHGPTGSEGPYDVLVGGQNTLKT